jgi:hypothetical protein
VALLGSVALLAAAGGRPEDGTGGPVYEVAAVKGKLLREEPLPEEELGVGARPRAGSVLRTGRRSEAELVCEAAATRFLLRARTRVRLAQEAPGVLLELERGRLRGVFEPLGVDPPPDRVVTTPSAVLAVRGTEYGLEVGRSGTTTLVVFEGTVELVDRERRGEPVHVGAGLSVRVRRGRPPEAPRPHRMTRTDWDRGVRMPPEVDRPDSRGGMPAGGVGRPGAGMTGAGDRPTRGGSGSRGGGGG